MFSRNFRKEGVEYLRREDTISHLSQYGIVPYHSIHTLPYGMVRQAVSKSSSLTLDGVTEKMMIYLARYTIPKYD